MKKRVFIYVLFLILLIIILIYVLYYLEFEKVQFGPSEEAIELDICGAIDFPGYYVLTKDLGGNEGADRGCFVINSDNVVLDGQGFSINGDSGDGDYGIFADARINITIMNLNITHFDRGIRLLTTRESFIFNNSLFLNDGPTGLGIEILSGSDENIISFNSISLNHRGLKVVSGSNNSIYSNFVGFNSGNGIFLQNSRNNSLNNNILNENAEFGLLIRSSSGNVVGGIINGSGQDGILIDEGSFGNTLLGIVVGNTKPGFYDIKLDRVNGTQLVNMVVGNYSFNGLVNLNNSFGEIRFLEGVNSVGNLSNDIKLNDNFVSIYAVGFNKSANITLFNLPADFENPRIMRDGNYSCNETSIPRCYNFTSLNAGNVIFNVSGWSNFSIKGENRTIVINDVTPPIVNIISPVNTVYTSLPLRFNVSLNEQGRVNFSLDNGIYNVSMSTQDNRSFSYTRSSISNGNYTFRVFASDLAGNKNNSVFVNFRVNITVNDFDEYEECIISSSQFITGYSRNWSLDDVCAFNVSNIEYYAWLENISGQRIILLIDPSDIMLGMIKGESRKINVNNDRYNDVLIRFDNLTSGKAVIFMKRINEFIPGSNGNGGTGGDGDENDDDGDSGQDDDFNDVRNVSRNLTRGNVSRIDGGDRATIDKGKGIFYALILVLAFAIVVVGYLLFRELKRIRTERILEGES